MTLFTSGLFCVKCPGKGSSFNRFKYYENRKSYVNVLLILQDVRFLFRCEKYFAYFSKLLPVKRLKVILRKRKLQLLTHDVGRYHIETSPLICSANQWTDFSMITASVLKELSILRCQDIPKNGLHSEITFRPQFTTTLKVTWKITFFKFWHVMYK